MVRIANDDTHGYDQTKRNGPDYDCSSLVATALYEAGFKVSPYSWTGNLKEQLLACAFAICKSPWQAGDVHLNEKHHVCMSINKTQIAQASINELGKVTGGKTGDQTGKEIWIRSYYDYPWDCHLRYVGPDVANNSKLSIETIAREVIAGRWGNYPERKTKLEKSGYDYVIVQTMVDAILSGKHLKSNEEIAREVIAMKWGVYPERKERLEKAGYDYNTIQMIVNKMMG